MDKKINRFKKFINEHETLRAFTFLEVLYLIVVLTSYRPYTEERQLPAVFPRSTSQAVNAQNIYSAKTNPVLNGPLSWELFQNELNKINFYGIGDDTVMLKRELIVRLNEKIRSGELDRDSIVKLIMYYLQLGKDQTQNISYNNIGTDRVNMQAIIAVLNAYANTEG